MSNTIYTQTNYTSPIYCVVGRYIYEYDIKHANISILHQAGEISDRTFDILQRCSKIDREIMIGKMLEKNSSKDAVRLMNILDQGFMEARKNIIVSNHIEDEYILLTRKDSIFVLDRKLDITKFGEIEFVLKNIYTSYYNLLLNNLMIFYGKKEIGFMQHEPYLVIKGISQDMQLLHKNYMIKAITRFIDMAENTALDTVIFELKEFMQKYRNRELDIGYYREFNAFSRFHITVVINGLITEYGIADVSDIEDPHNLNIGFNYEVLVRLFQIFLRRYLS